MGLNGFVSAFLWLLHKMDDTRFPIECGGYIGGKTFASIFHGEPKIIEFVDSLWQADKTTGVFKLFFVYVKNQLAIPDVRAEHETRCYAYVKNKDDMPPYMQKYITNQ